MKNKLSVVLYSDQKDRFYEAVSFAAAARAQGKTVLLFLRGPALAAHVAGKWSEAPSAAVRKGMGRHLAEDPAETLAHIRAHGKVHVYACSAWVRMLELDRAKVASKVDAVVGLNAFLTQAEGGPILAV